MRRPFRLKPISCWTPRCLREVRRYVRFAFLCRSNSVQPGTNKQSVAAIQLRNGTGVTVSGMCFSLGKSLPSLGHLNQKGLLPRVNGCACVLQTPHSVSLAIFCDRHFCIPN
jgi:hypothetical protein